MGDITGVWLCEDCKSRVDVNIRKPSIHSKACMLYGGKTKQTIVYGWFNYC